MKEIIRMAKYFFFWAYSLHQSLSDQLDDHHLPVVGYLRRGNLFWWSAMCGKVGKTTDEYAAVGPVRLTRYLL
jgi:hypothetical protein